MLFFSIPRMRRVLPYLLSTCMMITAVPLPSASASGVAWPPEWLADSAFIGVWSRADAPVAARAAARSWLWGPAPFAVANEEHAESPTGRRLVEYLDKARMEINDPSADRASPWFVTTGLLVYEMVSGRLQKGNNTFEQRTPAELPVAGDLQSPDAPTYAAFAARTEPSPRRQGVVMERISRDGTLSRLPEQGAHTDARLFGLTHFDEVSRHNVPAVFQQWLVSRGTVLAGGAYVQAQIMEPLYVLGRPVTEPYWADVHVAGKSSRILVQLFERRALTYNPNNPPEWRVEMANVGRAYYDWRYTESKPAGAVAAEIGGSTLEVRGWNWQPGQPVRVQVELGGGTVPVAGPQEGNPNAGGYFALEMPLTNELAGALQAKANLQVKAFAAGETAAMPLAGNYSAGPVQVNGVTEQVASGGGGIVGVRGRDGRAWSVRISATTRITYNEGDTAPADVLTPGAAVQVEGRQAGTEIRAETVRVLSASRTGAQLGYVWVEPGRSIRVSGSRWPGERQVSITLAPMNAGGPPALATARADSRGNFSTVVRLGPGSVPGDEPWLFATAAERGTLLAQVTIPFTLAEGAPGVDGPPDLYLLAPGGEQKGGTSGYCWRRVCVDRPGIPLPAAAVDVRAGEVLGLRSQLGPAANAGVSPQGLAVAIYSVPTGKDAEQMTFGGTLYFVPSGQPVYSSGRLPSRPFSVALPAVLARGEYVLVVNATWQDAEVGQVPVDYGFRVRVP